MNKMTIEMELAFVKSNIPSWDPAKLTQCEAKTDFNLKMSTYAIFHKQ